MNQPKVHLCPPILEPSSHLLPYPTPLGCHRAPALGSLHHTASSHWLSILHIVMCMFPCCSLNSSLPLLPPLCPQVCFLCLCVYSFPAGRFISTIFLDSILYALIYISFDTGIITGGKKPWACKEHAQGSRLEKGNRVSYHLVATIRLEILQTWAYQLSVKLWTNYLIFLCSLLHL